VRHGASRPFNSDGPATFKDGLSQNRLARAAWLSSGLMIVWDDYRMAKGYRPVSRDQLFLLPPDMREWLPPDHPVHLVITAVGEHLDTSAFHAGRKTGGAGAAGYDPDMLVTVLAWAYAHRVTSSRRIEELCRTDVAFRLICGGNLPDHATIARFRAAFPDAAAGLFAGVLALCARLGMGRLGTVALDGMKITASASKAANRTEGTLAKLAAEMVAAHAAADAAEDELFGGARGDEVPADAWRPGRRDERIAAALASLQAGREAAEEAERAKAAEFRARRAAGRRTGPAPLAAAVELAQEKLDRAVAAQQAKIDAWQARAAAARQDGRPLRGPGPVPAGDYVRVRQARAHLDRVRQRAETARARAAGREQNRTGPGPVRNITDPDSRLMPVRGGWFIQGYNAQNVTSEDGLVIATELTGDTTDTRWFEPMLRAAQDAAAIVGDHRPAGPGGGIGLVLADAGYCSEANLTTSGPDRLIATGKHRDLEKAARGQEQPGREPAGPATIAMAGRLKTSDGITAYRQRGHIAETPHGQIKHNMGLRQLTLRGMRKASAEWTFACAVHNLFKTISTGHLTSQALAGLAS
jgi:transposase